VSYYTRVTFEFSDEPPSVEDVSKTAQSWLVAQNLYAVDDVIKDLVRGWTEGQTDFNGHSDIEGLMVVVSAHRNPLLRPWYGRGPKMFGSPVRRR
jgi:hypothetical protein